MGAEGVGVAVTEDVGVAEDVGVEGAEDVGAVSEVGVAKGVGAKTSFNSSFRRPKSAGMTKNRGRK